MAISIVIMLALFIIDSRDFRINIDDHIYESKKKIDLLDKIIKDNYNIDSRDKIDALICMYRKYIDKQNESDKVKGRVIVGVFTAFGGMLSVSFSNLEIIGIDFLIWLNIASVLTFVVCFVCAYVYFTKYFDSTKRKYEHMINDLESLKIMKY